MKNIEKYKDEILNSSRADLTCCVNDSILGKNCYRTCNECKKTVMEWLLSEAKEPILDDKEREYLSSVIKPFRKNINYISKQENFDSSMEFIHIDLSDGDVADFPNFKADTLYRGMEVDKNYTLQELGL